MPKFLQFKTGLPQGQKDKLMVIVHHMVPEVPEDERSEDMLLELFENKIIRYFNNIQKKLKKEEVEAAISTADKIAENVIYTPPEQDPELEQHPISKPEPETEEEP